MGCHPERLERRFAVRPAVEELETRAVPAVLTPAQVRHAYGVDQVQFTANGKSVVGDGTGQTIGIVVAYNDPNIASDVDMFDKSFAVNSGGWQTLYSQYGSSSKFLTVAKPEGAPGTDSTGNWEIETALDVEWAHALAPGAKILLVEANTNSFNDLTNAVNYARNQPSVSVVSMSWGLGEFAGESSYESIFTTPAGHNGVTFVAASGDNGAPGNWPAVSPNVVDVGGTSLTVDAVGNYKSETAWSGSGGGVSSQEPRPGYQAGVEPSLTHRATPDVAANANPNTAGYVYDSFPVNGQKSVWWQWGGTSAAAPQWAALIAIADQGRALAGKGTLDGASQTLPALYSLPSSDFHDITSGSNGNAAKPGYDLATGLGSPVANRLIPGLVAYNGSAAPGSVTSSVRLSGTGATAKQSLFFRPVDAPDASMAKSPTNPTAVPVSFVVVTGPSVSAVPPVQGTASAASTSEVVPVAPVAPVTHAEVSGPSGGMEGVNLEEPVLENDAAPMLGSGEAAGQTCDEQGAKVIDAVKEPRRVDGPASTTSESMGAAALALGAFWTAVAEPKRKTKSRNS